MVGNKFLTINYEIWKKESIGAYGSPEGRQICIEIDDLKDLFKMIIQSLGEKREGI